MSDYAGATFLGSPNHAPGRRAYRYVVMHTMVGSEAAANARFQNPAQQASANYGVKLNGQIVQWVHEADTAYCNGTYYDNPGANVDSISIEHEDNGDYNGPRTPALYEASAQLVADICNRHSIPIDRAHVIKHKECFQASTACPDALNVDGIVARAQQLGLHGGSGGTITGADMTQDEHNLLVAMEVQIRDQLIPGILNLGKQMAALTLAIQNVPAGTGGGLSAAQSQKLDGIASDIAEIRLKVDKDLA